MQGYEFVRSVYPINDWVDARNPDIENGIYIVVYATLNTKVIGVGEAKYEDDGWHAPPNIPAQTNTILCFSKSSRRVVGSSTPKD